MRNRLLASDTFIDLGVAEPVRRQGVATELIETIKVVAQHHGIREDVMYFDILPGRQSK